MGDPLTELLKVVDVSIAAAIGVIAAFALDQLVGGFLNTEKIFGFIPNPVYHWNTDRAMPVVTMLFGGCYGWFLGTAPGYGDNIKQGLIYGAVALAASRLFRKTILGG